MGVGWFLHDVTEPQVGSYAVNRRADRKFEWKFEILPLSP
ncbi:hypothetical protein NPIL_467081, partial [Nephila pilipes]